jgi:hypothetical protein
LGRKREKKNILYSGNRSLMEPDVFNFHPEFRTKFWSRINHKRGSV